MDWTLILKDIEDSLFQTLKLSVWERVLYYRLLRETHVSGKESVLISLPSLANSIGASDWTIRRNIRSLAKKGCIVIDDRSRKGHFVRVLLPSEISSLASTKDEPVVDIATLDFFTGRKYLLALLHRDQDRCFYCLKKVSAESCALDHALCQANGGDNSFRNIVVSCHTCNSEKGSTDPSDFLRTLHRRDALSSTEFQDRLAAPQQLRNGELVPDLRYSVG
jgi:5-methylcytosine-specific restriction endonuclease McrA